MALLILLSISGTEAQPGSWPLVPHRPSVGTECVVKYKAGGEFKALSHTAQPEKGNHNGQSDA